MSNFKRSITLLFFLITFSWSYAQKADSLKSINLLLKVVDLKSGEPIAAEIEIAGMQNGVISFKGVGKCDQKGVFQFDLARNSLVVLAFNAIGYLPVTEEIDFNKLDTLNQKRVSRTYQLRKLESGTYIKLDKILFEQGKYSLLPASYRQLDDLTKLLKTNPKVKIEIAGHTENVGSKKTLIKLSEQRVESVKEYLVEKGIKSSRIKSVGYGPTKPLNTKSDDEAQKENRRVEFKITKM